MKFTDTRLLGILLCTLSFSIWSASHMPIQQAMEWLKNGKAEAAFDLLLPLEDEYAGTPDFDYLLGLSALDMGKATLAIMAFERVLMVDNDHLPARAELARAYLLLGETDAAQENFQAVQAVNPPPLIAKSIQKYLDLLDTNIKPQDSSVSIWAETTIGYDTNVNVATSLTHVTVPALGSLALGASGQASDDGFATVGGGLQLNQSLNKGTQWVGSLRFSETLIDSEINHQFESSQLTGDLGLRHQLSVDKQITGAILAQKYNVEHAAYRNMYGLNLGYIHALNETQAINVSVQALRLNYLTQPIQNVNRYSLSAAFAKALPNDLNTTLLFSGSLGTEKALASARPDLGHQFFSGKVASTMKMNDKTDLMLSMGYQHKQYGGKHAIFGLDRKDNQWDLSVNLAYQWDDNIKVTPQISFTKNNSNVPINEYNRRLATVNIRYSFD